ncbi:zinc-binding alcohol dehydrogenase family protein [Sphingomonas sp. BK580]|uniref:zinc-binding alcohol dehydrogenase family protein n=1 Tax=Sphingomonas sp. BK580 TaxID=2586972 RepID=UPI0016143F11|nr:zinc-binding alcohol dehydrogenase family protein [Sphingomonas sp. BK580]MBB3695620.1 NADPH:quinone reductase-like Zn-dependent oxidoreductase [Sphingomonas sp. BK580]
MTENTALWLPAKRAAFVTGDAPYPMPEPGQIVVRARAVAVNPMDRLTQTMGDIITPYLHYPTVMGSDVAGEVVAVGRNVTRFQVGDRVLGHATGSDKARNSAAEGAFQTYVVILAHMAAPIPGDLSFEAASVLPLALSTAACGLFQQDLLALTHPVSKPAATGETLLVWGGSTSVGSNAIQLAVAAGYDVVTTASPRNADYLKRLGASQVFDYRKPTVVADIIAALRGRKLAGAIAIGVGSGGACVDVVAACEGRRFVALATPPTSFDAVPAGKGRWRALVPAMARMLAGNAALMIKARRRRVGTKFIWGSALLGNEVGPMIYEKFLPTALAEQRYVAAPPAVIAGHGLDAIPAALERQRRGVSASKLVVTL